AGSATLGGDGVAAHGIHLGNYGDPQGGINFGGSDSCAQAGGPTADEQNIVRRNVHGHPTSGKERARRPTRASARFRHIVLLTAAGGKWILTSGLCGTSA